jgi:photosystem II stability/assembly factor-like uncharacterized protein
MNTYFNKLEHNILVIFIVIIISINSYSQGEIGNANWEVLNNGAGIGYGPSIDFVNDQVGWLAGNNALLKTEDGGDTWINIPVSFKFDFRNIDFINENVGWLIGYGALLKTEDGGLTWTEKRSGTITNIYAVNDSVVYVTVENIFLKIFLKTLDGGENWIDVTQDEDIRRINSMWFFNADSGIVAGQDGDDNRIILQTFDGGNSWIRTAYSSIRRFTNLQFINDSTGYFLAGNSICFTSDVFNSWTTVTDSSLDIRSFDYFDDDKVCAVIWDSIQGSQVMTSTDRGITWERTDLPSGWMSYKIYFHNPNLGFLLLEIAGGRGGFLGYILYKSVNGGKNWTIQELTYPLYNVVFFDRNTGFISGGVSEWHGGSGDLFKTIDGGKSWINSFHSSFQVKSISFIDPQTGFILSNQTQDGTNSNIHKTINGGISWDEVYADKGDSIGLYFAGEEICFLNGSVGWVAGTAFHDDTSGAAFLHTENGGDTWNVIWVNIDSEDYHNRIYSFYFLDETAGWAVGERGLIVKYSDNRWQVQPRVSDLPLKDVFFSDENHGWIASGFFNDQDFQSTIFKTTDGGITWQEKRVSDYIINDMFFKDSLNGLAVGNDTSSIDIIGCWQRFRGRGVILETNDGGENWSVVIDELSASLTAIYSNDGYVWTTGETGLLLRTCHDSIWTNQNTGEIYPSKYNLFL